MHALMFEAFGGPEVLEWRPAADPEPGPRDVLVRLEAAGMNYADVYRRQGRFRPAGPPPWIPGYEGAGTIEAVGPEAAAAGFKAGDRVGWADSPNSNAERVAVPLEKLIRLPEAIDAATAASVLLQGMTAHYLVHDSHPVTAGEWAVVHAAGGGVGLLLVQLIRRLGGRVIALASSPEKRQAALDAGAEAAVGYDGWIEAVQQLTDRGADVVFDSVGTTIKDSLAAVRSRGRAVFYGVAGGQPPAVEPLLLMERSLTLTGGDLWSMIDTPDTRQARASDLFGWITDGSLRVNVAETFRLADGPAAHRFVESRAAIGKVLLVP